MMAISPPAAGAHTKVVNSAGTPVADYYEPEHQGNLRLWLKPSGTMARNSGFVSRVFSSSNFALAKTASKEASAYVGHTIVVSGQNRIITAYTGDVNGDGDVLDAGEAEVFLDEPLNKNTFLGSSRTAYKVFEGFSVTAPAEAARVAKEAGHGNDILQWASAARTVVLGGDVWSTADTADRVLLGPSAQDIDGIYAGLTLVIGSESRAITHYNGNARVATVSPPFSQQPRSGVGFRVVRVHAARVATVPLMTASVLAVSQISPTMRFQIHAPFKSGILPADFTGHEMTVTTGSEVNNCVVLAHTADGFVSVTALTVAASNVSTFVVHGARPTLMAGTRSGLEGYGAVTLDGVSSFLTIDSAMTREPKKRRSIPNLDSNSTAFYAPRNCSASRLECLLNDEAFETARRAAATASEKWSMTLLSLVRPRQDEELSGLLAPLHVSSGTLALPDQGIVYEAGSAWVRLGRGADDVQDLYTGKRVRLRLLDGTKVDRIIVSYALDRRALLDAPVPLELVPSKTRFFVTNADPTASAMALDEHAPARAGALVGMQIAIAGEWRTVLSLLALLVQKYKY